MRLFVAALMLCAACSAARAHGLEHTVSYGDAVVVTITHDDGSPFAFEAVEVLPPGETIPFQQGRTDARGRFAFVPDGDGDWRLRAFSEDGHGLDILVPVSSGTDTTPARSGGRLSRTIMGVSILFGIFGVIALFIRRRA